MRVFEEESCKLTDATFLAQGTLYPDVIESGTKSAAKIKTHHNVGGLPENMNLKLVEPLRYLFKDEVRAVAEELGLPSDLVWRQPFPGPGLAIRITGEVTKERLDLLRSADWIIIDEIKKGGLYRKVWQSFAVLVPDQKRRRHGRPAHLRLPHRPARRHQRRRHDRRLGASALRGAGPHLQPHRQRSPRHQPRGLGHHQQAARHD